MVNLLVDLDERFGNDRYVEARVAIDALGYEADSVSCECEIAYKAWIDDVFGGTWSSEADFGTSLLVWKRDSEENDHAAFATYDAKRLRFSWLRGVGREAGVGIFGPFGVAPAHRKSGIGPPLLVAVLGALKERGYARALIPAVGEEKLVDYYVKHSGARVVESFDKRSFVERRYRTIVMASGSGTNFQAVLDAANAGRLPLDLAAVVCSEPDAYVLERARAAGIPVVVVAWHRHAETRTSYDARLLEAVRGLEPELVLLLGWMHILDSAFVATFEGRTINLHPAFLPFAGNEETVLVPDGGEIPSFRGPHAVRDAIAGGAKWFGATTHEVSVEADRGRVLVRKPVRLPDGADFGAAMEILRPAEHKVVEGGIMRWVYER